MSCHDHHRGIEDSFADLELLDMLTAPVVPDPHELTKKGTYRRRDSDLDPLLLAAAASYGHVTRNHYAHDFFPAVGDPRAEGAYDWTKWQPGSLSARPERKVRLKYESRQTPRSLRLKQLGLGEEKGNDLARTASTPLRCADNLPLPTPKSAVPGPPSSTTSQVANAQLPPGHQLEAKCMARTRVPTPHGPVFLHLYHNNRDNKEHLAIVVDPAQLQEDTPSLARSIRSRTLDAVWSDSETEMERITRGAYVGRLSKDSQRPSRPPVECMDASTLDIIPPPLIRIHSECFTGETIGSMRCDCGEQLDEAIRQIALPVTVTDPSGRARTIPGRGAVIYMRQEGRGIGLLSKIRAYNLQDLGHDTVTANLMLGHGADERGYEVASAIMRDLGLGANGLEGIRLLTNNPDKMHALEKEDIRIVERVPMVPRSWQRRQQHKLGHDLAGGRSQEDEKVMGATMIGGGEVYGEDLDKYLRTKVLRMGHMLPLLLDESD